MTLSIIVPSLRPDRLKMLLDSIKEHTADVDHEILTTDLPGGIYKAVNIEFDKCRGKFVVQLPDDVLVTMNWAKNMILFMDTKPDLFIGSFTMTRKMIEGDGIKRMQPVSYYGREFSCFPFVRREIVGRIGGYMDEGYNSFYGDPDLSMRMWRAGGSVETCQDAEIFTDRLEDDVKLSSRQKYEDLDRQTFEARWGRL